MILKIKSKFDMKGGISELKKSQKTSMTEDQKKILKNKNTEKSIRDTKSMRQKKKRNSMGVGNLIYI